MLVEVSAEKSLPKGRGLPTTNHVRK